MVENFMSVCSFVLLFLFIVGFIGLFVFTFRTAVLSNPIFEYSIGLKKSQYSHGTWNRAKPNEEGHKIKHFSFERFSVHIKSDRFSNNKIPKSLTSKFLNVWEIEWFNNKKCFILLTPFLKQYASYKLTTALLCYICKL